MMIVDEEAELDALMAVALHRSANEEGIGQVFGWVDLAAAVTRALATLSDPHRVIVVMAFACAELQVLGATNDNLIALSTHPIMAFDEKLATRMREILSERVEVSERRMFGGLAFMVHGHMACGIVGDDLMLRVGVDGFDEAIKEPHARPMDFTGRPSRGMVYVAPAGVRTKASLRSWIETGIAFVETLPPK
jgi:TfoX/Sxy family transcriptional regulator of competence genes